MKRVRLSIFIFALAVLPACSNTSPQVGLLSAVSADLKFNPSTIDTASWSSVALSADCSSLVSSVEVSLDNGQSWLAPSALDPQASDSCGNGRFSITLSNSRAPLNTFSFVSGQLTNVQFRAHSRFGFASTSLLQIKYTPVAQNKQEILVGSQNQSAGGLVLRGRARGLHQQASSGGSFRLKGWIR